MKTRIFHNMELLMLLGLVDCVYNEYTYDNTPKEMVIVNDETVVRQKLMANHALYGLTSKVKWN